MAAGCCPAARTAGPANAGYKQQMDNENVTEIVELPNRGHALVIDHGWREVADTALKLRSTYRPGGISDRHLIDGST
jgi:hypothetical protein